MTYVSELDRGVKKETSIITSYYRFYETSKLLRLNLGKSFSLKKKLMTLNYSAYMSIYVTSGIPFHIEDKDNSYDFMKDHWLQT